MMLSPYFWLTLLGVIAIVGCVKMFFLLKSEAEPGVTVHAKEGAASLTKWMIVVLTFTLIALGLCRISSKGQEFVTVKQVYPVVAGGTLIVTGMGIMMLYLYTKDMSPMIKTIAKVIPACTMAMATLVGWEMWGGNGQDKLSPTRSAGSVSPTGSVRSDRLDSPLAESYVSESPYSPSPRRYSPSPSYSPSPFQMTPSPEKLR